jgi:hypothetical protein
MEELESHLWAEMDEIVVTEGCTEEEAFTRSVVNIGSTDHVYPEFEKNQPFLKKAENWIHQKSIPIIITLALLVAFLFADSIFVNHHSFKVFQEKAIENKGIIKLNRLTLNGSVNREHPISFKSKSFDQQSSVIFYHVFYWFKDSKYDETRPVFVGNTYTANGANFIFVLDTNNNLWIDQDGNFNYYSKKIQNITPVRNRMLENVNEDGIAERRVIVKNKKNIGLNSLDSNSPEVKDDFMNHLLRNNENLSMILILDKHGKRQYYASLEVKDNLKLYQYDSISDWFEFPIPEEHPKQYKVVDHSIVSIRVSEQQIYRITYCQDINTKEPFLYFEEGFEAEKPIHIVQYLINQIIGKNLLEIVF